MKENTRGRCKAQLAHTTLSLSSHLQTTHRVLPVCAPWGCYRILPISGTFSNLRVAGTDGEC